ncbi:NAD-dependent epimerase/dehydratase family protein [uncultured Hoeflea sp.]|uniref:NAD-dependent epimerase/dehydratase family protein n=1 Tax=uncultured Hoeflea sp. TaxID=538666 RepID=UPI002618548F|nr:NAD-dependent epimerase/dehydratase family protein [uncultured Hoeflea sp.]
MRYLITGTAGFVGFHLAKQLLEAGHIVTGFDGMTPYYDVRLKQMRHTILERHPNFTAVVGLLEDAHALSEAAKERPDVIMHLAGQAGVRYSVENPKAYFDSNLAGSWNVLELARKHEVSHLMLASTSSVYGANQSIPYSEADKADEPLTFYAASKKAMEVMAHSYAHVYGIPTTAFRFFTVYGPWGRPDMALFKFVKAILEDKEIEIYGEGRMSRDFTYVDDLVGAIIDLSHVVPSETNRVRSADVEDTLSAMAPFRVVNIGGGQPFGLLDFIDVIERTLDKKARRKLLPMQTGDMERTFANADLLTALTGSKPQTPLETGVRAFVEWYLRDGTEYDFHTLPPAA